MRWNRFRRYRITTRGRSRAQTIVTIVSVITSLSSLGYIISERIQRAANPIRYVRKNLMQWHKKAQSKRRKTQMMSPVAQVISQLESAEHDPAYASAAIEPLQGLEQAIEQFRKSDSPAMRKLVEAYDAAKSDISSFRSQGWQHQLDAHRHTVGASTS